MGGARALGLRGFLRSPRLSGKSAWWRGGGRCPCVQRPSVLLRPIPPHFLYFFIPTLFLVVLGQTQGAWLVFLARRWHEAVTRASRGNAMGCRCHKNNEPRCKAFTPMRDKWLLGEPV